MNTPTVGLFMLQHKCSIIVSHGKTLTHHSYRIRQECRLLSGFHYICRGVALPL